MSPESPVAEKTRERPGPRHPEMERDKGLQKEYKADKGEDKRSKCEKRVLCVGLVCLDIINVVDQFPKEDSDTR